MSVSDNTQQSILTGLKRPKAFHPALLFPLIDFLDECAYSIMLAALPALRAELGLIYVQVGMLLGLPGVVNLLLEPPILLLGDTGARKRIILFGGAVLSGALWLAAGSRSFPPLLAAVVLYYPPSGAVRDPLAGEPDGHESRPRGSDDGPLDPGWLPG
jgi:MFS family permease